MTQLNENTLRFGRMAPMLPVTDIDRARAFYIEIFGFRQTFKNGNPVGFVILKRDQAELHLTLDRNHRPAVRNSAHLMVSDVDALHSICQTHGVRIIKSLQNKDYGLRAFVFEDSEGNRVDVGQPI